MWQHAERAILLGFLQSCFQGCGYLGSASFRIVRHLVESLAVVVVLQLAEGLHRAVKIVVDDGEAVAVVVESLPARVVEVLRIVGEIHATLQHVLATLG